MKLDEDETAYLEEPYLPHPVIGHLQKTDLGLHRDPSFLPFVL
ncbi:hypothetical protein [Paenibacillus harenae]|nr:hypothetical protein [Paenibacillus harenae]